MKPRSMEMKGVEGLGEEDQQLEPPPPSVQLRTSSVLLGMSIFPSHPFSFSLPCCHVEIPVEGRSNPSTMPFLTSFLRFPMVECSIPSTSYFSPPSRLSYFSSIASSYEARRVRYNLRNRIILHEDSLHVSRVWSLKI